jgi:hypothetical protein
MMISDVLMPPIIAGPIPVFSLFPLEVVPTGRLTNVSAMAQAWGNHCKSDRNSYIIGGRSAA